MFEAPSAKRVKRSRLFSSTSSPASSDNDSPHKASERSSKSNKSHSKNTKETPDITMKDVPINYGFEYDFVDNTTQQSTARKPSHDQNAHNTEPALTARNGATTESKEQSYEFNLFRPKPKLTSATSSSTSKPQPALSTETQPPTSPTSQITTPSALTTTTTPNPPTKITIRSPTPDALSLFTDPLTKPIGPGSILHPRPKSHYLTSHTPSSTLSRLKSEYTSAAVTPSTLLTTLYPARWPGTHLPWRTIHIPRSRLISSPHHPPPTSTTPTDAHQRRRPSKRRRIHTRTLAATRLAMQEKTKIDAEAEREKRTKRNREKKVKRKLREKAKKAGVVDGNEGGDAGEDGGGGDE